MATFKSFEDIEAWQLARALVKEMFIIFNEKKLKTEFELMSQFKRANISIMNNIAEGYGRYSNADFIRFLDYASASASEVKSMLYVMEDLNFLNPNDAQLYRGKVDVIQSKILGLIKYLRNHKKPPKCN
ncbi:MAG: four helix bundle protein [Salinivirgaceae bacterium]|jgi:four helix bundle protein|nr:four helix bundle protein [Salinivirgaceae bacterium]